MRSTLRDGRSPLLLTERREHLEVLAEPLWDDAQHLVILIGGMPKLGVKRPRGSAPSRRMRRV